MLRYLSLHTYACRQTCIPTCPDLHREVARSMLRTSLRTANGAASTVKHDSKDEIPILGFQNNGNIAGRHHDVIKGSVNIY